MKFITKTMMAAGLAARRCVRDHLGAIAAAPADAVGKAIAAAYAPHATWRGSHPLNGVDDIGALGRSVWEPLKRAMPDLERRDLLMAAGRYRTKAGEVHDLVACMGHYCATFVAPFCAIQPTGQPVLLRYGEVHRVEGGRIVQSSCLWDLLDLMMQAGFDPLPPSWGTETVWQAPITGDGLAMVERDAAQGAASIAQTLAMHQALADYDDHAMAGRDGLIAMPQRDHWHPKMMWYGPAGIGTTRALEGFVDFHQLPFRLTFPGRKGGQTLVESDADPRVGHYIQIGDGPYSVTGGWPSVIAQHTGSDLFGSGPTGRRIEMRVMDFYLHHEGLIRENWVPIDVPHILMQMGVDVFARMRDRFGPDRLGLRHQRSRRRPT